MRSSVAGHSLTECEPLVESALRFATTLLKYSETFYPFGLLSISGQTQSIFTQHGANVDMQGGMIEEIEWLLLELRFQADNTRSVLIYNAQVESADTSTIDVIATKIIDHSGAETTQLFPYQFAGNQVCIGKPIVF